MPTITATITAYCICTACCGDTHGLTASGVLAKPGITVAAPRSVPFGTTVYIPGVGRRVVQDRTARRYNGRWDVLMASHSEAMHFGKRKLPIRWIK